MPRLQPGDRRRAATGRSLLILFLCRRTAGPLRAVIAVPTPRVTTNARTPPRVDQGPRSSPHYRAAELRALSGNGRPSRGRMRQWRPAGRIGKVLRVRRGSSSLIELSTRVWSPGGPSSLTVATVLSRERLHARVELVLRARSLLPPRRAPFIPPPRARRRASRAGLRNLSSCLSSVSSATATSSPALRFHRNSTGCIGARCVCWTRPPRPHSGRGSFRCHTRRRAAAAASASACPRRRPAPPRPDSALWSRRRRARAGSRSGRRYSGGVRFGAGVAASDARWRARGTGRPGLGIVAPA